MASGMTTEVIETSVRNLINHRDLRGQSNHAYHEMAPQYVLEILKANGLDDQMARRIQFDVLYLSEIVRGFINPRAIGKLAFNKADLDQLGAQMKRKG